MKQPELGKKISELRKNKSMTQEELVEACNVSVRTLQRIESGDVIPRTSTIKIILTALGEDFNSFKTSTDSDVELLRMENWLQMAWISGIVYFIVGFLESGLDYIRFEEGDADISWIFYVSVKLVASVSYVIFLGGFTKLGEFFNNSVLRVAVYLLISFTVLIISFDIMSLFIPVSDQLLLAILPAQSISIGAAGIVFGIGLLKLQDGMGRAAALAGFLELFIGFCFAIVVLFFLGLILIVPALIIEIIILYRGYEFIRMERGKESNQ